MKRKWIHAVGIFFAIILLLLCFWHQPKFSDIEEMQSMVVTQQPKGFSVCDLDSDGNDEILVTTTTAAYIVALQQHRFISFPVPLFDVRVNFPRGYRLIGRTKLGEIAVAEWQSLGKWQVQILAHSGNDYAIGDLGEEGKDDDAFVVSGSRLLWFQRQPDGLWKYVGELQLPFGKGFIYAVERWGVKLGSGSSLIFWDGQWKFGKPDEQVHLFRANWDGWGKSDRLLVRYLPKSDEVTFLLRKGDTPLTLKAKMRFDGWQTFGITATNELGNGQWHLLLVQFDGRKQMRLLDCFFTSKGWQVNEIAKWQATSVPDYAVLHVGDANGDGKSEIVVTSTGVWLFGRTAKGWTIRSLIHHKGRHYCQWKPLSKIGKHLWFCREVGEMLPPTRGFGVEMKFSEIGNFQTNGRWEPKFRWRGFVYQPKQLADLNGDGHPEFLGLLENGLISPQPILWRRLENGNWKPLRLTTPSLYRALKMISINLSPFVDAEQLFLAQWRGKKWFVIFWDDGFMQAVTLKGH